MQIYKNLFKSTSIKIRLIFWDAAVIISNSNRCCFCVCDPLFSVIQFIHLLPKFFKFKNNTWSDQILQNVDHELAFHFPFFHNNPWPGSPNFNTFPSFPHFPIWFTLNFWFLRKYFSPLGLEPATSECWPRALPTSLRWFSFSDFKAFFQDQNCTLISLTSALSGTVLSVFFGLFCLGLFCNLGLFCPGLFCLFTHTGKFSLKKILITL